ncbi:unnamed protein product [Urochloa decumbens]|uniref:Bifunctional inhibitor/plant lipid transfer protein/seed storage helical domain-containing protein n=1 Tax=Urochloa decumbens TaxID=240449 RepID=A0ABC8Y7H6_9POAL
MTKQQQVGMVVCALLLVVVVVLAGGASAATCNAGQLSVCLPAITSGSKPSSGCCSGLKSQQGCFCQFVKNPALGRYVSSPNARKTLAACGVAVPRC